MSNPTPTFPTFGGGRYRILEQVGLGGMGAVYRAVQEPLGRTVALKVLQPEFSQNHAIRRRFTREARAVAALNHPNIATVFDFGTEDDGTLFLAMEFVEGLPLTWLMDTGLTPQHLLAALDPILAAHAHAHARGVIHRDLKPDNILISYKPGTSDLPTAQEVHQMPQLVKLVDFGIARVHDNLPDEPGDTASGQVVGTPLYMSPEQARGERLITQAADLYSLGVILFEGLTGHHPYATEAPDETPFDIMVRHVTSPLPNLTSPPGVYVPQALRAVARRCLQKRPGDRYPSAAELRTALREAATLLDAWLLSQNDSPPPEQRVRRSREARTTLPEAGTLPDPNARAQAVIPSIPPAAHPPPAAELPPPPTVRFDVPLVGRSDERAQIQRAVERCVNESVGQVVLISGEAGIGKTKLVTSLQESLAEAGQLTSLTGAFLRDSGDGLRGLRDALETLFGVRALRRPQAQDAVMEKLRAWGLDDPHDAEALTTFMRPADAPSSRNKDHQDALFALLVRVLERASRAQPILLLLDDIHWAGSDLAELLEYLAVEFRYRPCNLVVAGTIRAEDLHNNPRLHSGIRRLARYAGETVTRIQLERLDEAACLDLIQQILPPSPELARMVALRSQGNPLHLVQLLHFLHQERLIAWDPKAHAFTLQGDPDDIHRVPPSLADLLLLRLEQLQHRYPPELHLQELLLRAAVLGSRFPFEALAELLRLEENQPALQALDSAIDTLLLESVLVHVKGRTDDQLTFHHGLFREVILESLQAPRTLKRLHRFAALAKKHVYRDRLEQAAQDIAHHFTQASEHRAALDFILLAANAARASYRLRDATRLYLEAAALTRDLNLADLRTLPLTIARRLGGLYEGFGEFRQAQHGYATLLKLALFEGQPLFELTPDNPPPLDPPAIHLLLEALDASPRWARHEPDARQEILRATLGLGRTFRQLGQQKTAVRFLKKSLQLAIEAQAFTWITASRILLGRCAWDEGDYDTAEELGHLALDDASSHADAFSRADALHLLAEVARLRGDPARTADFMTRAREAWEILDDRRRVATCLRDLAQLARARGDLDHAAQLFSDARNRFEQLGDRHAVASCLNGLGEVARFKGNLQVAERCYQRAWETFNSLGARVDAAIALTNLGLTALSHGKLDKAEQTLLRVQEATQDLHHPYLALGLHTNIAWLRALQGRWDDAEPHIHAALDHSQRHNISDPDYARPLEQLGLLMQQHGRHDQAQSLLDLARSMWSTLGQKQR